MRFELVDRIIAYEPGRSIRTVKALTLAEEYLQDHFPSKPVMPGVIMVEAMVQSCAWMVRLETNFAPAIVVLKEARGVRYDNFVRPGDLLVVDVELQKMGAGRAVFKGQGAVNGSSNVRGKLDLEYDNLADTDGSKAHIDEFLRKEMRRRFRIVNDCEIPDVIVV